VAEALREHGARVQVLVSAKKVDQRIARTLSDVDVLTLPAISSSWTRFPAFVRAGVRSVFAVRAAFRHGRPGAVLAMGGFAAVPVALAARSLRIPLFLHEANAVPGRANRWLMPLARGAFVYFPEAGVRLRPWPVLRVGMPVRPTFQPGEPAASQMALGLQPGKAVLLVMGGSQGASALNRLVAQSLDLFAVREPELQFLHLTGEADADWVRRAYQQHQRRAVVRPFLSEMDLGFSAATVAVTRAGASSLAEQAAMRLPSILVPYPCAADDHQLYNARAFVETGAARLLCEAEATPSGLVAEAGLLLRDAAVRTGMQTALAAWHQPDAAECIARHLLESLSPPACCDQVKLSSPALPGFTDARPVRQEDVDCPNRFQARLVFGTLAAGEPASPAHGHPD
jgi:UDP-N-acetylglucosamine--N-acetylmuramyl-(pentapeptide) pyrophosphoryl-undecaprenol N-acetylglucosamine transferase